jgi:uncharacterized protein (DUF2147 family)
MAETSQMRSVKLPVLALTAALALSPTLATAQTDISAVGVFGVWRNPKDSVHLEIKTCGASTCGFVVWANAHAQEDARKGGTANLVGAQLLRDFTPQKNGAWRGKVFVPDLNMTFSGTAEVLDANRLKAKGCVLINVLCKSQIWTRVEGQASLDKAR